MKLTVTNAMPPLTARWINENLLYVRIVFGRITLMALATYEPWVIPQALDFMRRHSQHYPFQKLISHTFPLSEINEAFQQADAGTVIRASIVP